MTDGEVSARVLLAKVAERIGAKPGDELLGVLDDRMCVLVAERDFRRELQGEREALRRACELARRFLRTIDVPVLTIEIVDDSAAIVHDLRAALAAVGLAVDAVEP